MVVDENYLSRLRTGISATREYLSATATEVEIESLNDVYNEPALYKDIKLAGDENDRFSIAACRRKATGTYKHLQTFSMVEIVRRGSLTPDDVLDQTIKIICLLSGRNYSQTLSEAKFFDYGTAVARGKVHVGLNRTCEISDESNFPSEVIEQQKAYKLDLESALACLEHDREASFTPGCLLVLKNMPPHPFAATEAQIKNRIEIYANVQKHRQPLELANLYQHNIDKDNLIHRGVPLPITLPDFKSVDIGIGIERCLMLGLGLKDIKPLAFCPFHINDNSGE